MKLDIPVKDVCEIPFGLKVKDLNHWKENTTRQEEYEQHQFTETIFLRFRKDLNTWFDFELVDYPLMDFYREDVEKHLKVLSEHYTFKDYAVIIANLKSGGVIPLHYDSGYYFESSHRVHIPIKTNEDVFFKIDSEIFNMKCSHAYEIDNVGSVHGVLNRSMEDRYHIIFDLFV